MWKLLKQILYTFYFQCKKIITLDGNLISTNIWADINSDILIHGAIVESFL